MTPPGEKTKNPVLPEWSIPVAFHFSVTIDKKTVSFSDVKGIDFSMDVEPLTSGGDSFTCYYLPKSKKYSDLVLSRGILKKNDDFFKWCFDALVGPAKKDCIKLKNVLVSLLDENNKPLKTWIFKHAYPIKWSLGEFNAMKSDVVVETVSIKYNSVSVKVG
jgi:phage tail-like protein